MTPAAPAFEREPYIVDDIRVVAPEDVGQLAPTSDDPLTLVTCYPFGRSPRSPQRYIVRALPVGPSRSTWLSPAVDNSCLRNVFDAVRHGFF